MMSCKIQGRFGFIVGCGRTVFFMIFTISQFLHRLPKKSSLICSRRPLICFFIPIKKTGKLTMDRVRGLSKILLDNQKGAEKCEKEKKGWLSRKCLAL